MPATKSSYQLQHLKTRPSNDEREFLGEMWHACYRTAIDDRVLDLVCVGATLDLEEAMVTPVLIPAVCHQPVRGTIFCPIAHDLDSMAPKHGVPKDLAHVHPGLVGQKALVHKKHACDRPILVDLLHHRVCTGTLQHPLLAYAVASLAALLASGPRCAIVNTLAGARRGLGGIATIGILRGVAVMSTGSKLIGVTHRLVP